MKTTSKAPVQRPSGMPTGKYLPFLQTNPVSLPDRTWPNKQITRAPRWLSTDLRDGNQALIEPMDPARKREMFNLLIRLGYKEIEIGFPAASQTDFDFVRSLIEDDAVPEDVCVSVLTQARADLIGRTVESLVGFPRANVHMYNATAPVFREVVFHNDMPATIALAEAGTREVIAQAEKYLGDETIFGFQYSPEIFIDTERDFALEICEKVMEIWQVGPDREIILNLPATIERSTPNVYADQVEWMSRNVSNREYVCISAHPHNDRGTSIATAELAMLAGADRIEGCLLGQGERTGNVDLVTLGLNMFSQGVDPMIDFSDVDGICRVVEHCTRMSTPPRIPYVGELVYTSFSGSHQDAIKKGFLARDLKVQAAGGDESAVAWELPYLPIDPHDVGRSYEAVVRVNSQSGKGGIAYVMHTKHKLDLPRRLQVELSRIVQRHAEYTGGELQADAIWSIFVDEYLPASESGTDTQAWGRLKLGTSKAQTFSGDEGSEDVVVSAVLTDNGQEIEISAHGNGPIDAFVHALEKLDIEVRVLDYAEHALSAGRDAKAAAYVECAVGEQILWGVGIDSSITRASYKAVISAVNRALR